MNSNFVWWNRHHNLELVLHRLHVKMASMIMLLSNGLGSDRTKGVFRGVFR